MADTKLNGHVTRGRRLSEVVIQKIDEHMYREENIFLFLPNLIGGWSKFPGMRVY